MSQPEMIKVWDPLVRIFHWTLVLAFTVAYFTEDDFLTPHVWAGYLLLALLLIRIIWGFIGSPYARFNNFVYSIATIKSYLKDTIAFRSKRYLGHNPAGGAMILLLIFSLLITSISGLAIYGIEEKAGPLASMLGHLGEFWEEVTEEIHEFFANFTLFLIFIHIAGVIFESLMHKESLVKAMFNGYKRRQDVNRDNH
ncbi:Cytochrome b [hydrothermal vent metagenome]|uniref:Cytochrome b n=1 Tax=hydrothermal vent metagenome TaxID=652676 RepID=A0A3B1BYD9_9ZZZZ